MIVDNTLIHDQQRIVLSATFIEFLALLLDGNGFGDQVWSDQITESMNRRKCSDAEKLEWQLDRLLLHAPARAVIQEVAALSSEIRAGTGATVEYYRSCCRLICIIGVPRTGGSYVTAELFAALGHNPRQVPAALAHDGFPEMPLSRSGNRHSNKAIHGLAEYLVMARLFFQGCQDKQFIIPKKFPKAIRQWNLIDRVFGNKVETVVTIRDPLSCCVSAYEKAGGLPEGSRFRVRSVIEKWALRDLIASGASHANLTASDYFRVMISYWAFYYNLVATSGALSAGKVSILTFSSSRIGAFATSNHIRFGSKLEPSTFIESEPGVRRHPEWRVEAINAVHDVALTWASRGLTFPAEELMSKLE